MVNKTNFLRQFTIIFILLITLINERDYIQIVNDVKSIIF